MRSPSLFVFLSAVLLTATIAQAKPSDGNEDLSTALTRIKCPTSPVAVTDQTAGQDLTDANKCKQAAFTICTAPNAKGCSSYFQGLTSKPSSKSRPFNFDWGTPTNIGQVHQKAEEGEKQIKQFFDDAQKCCNNPEQCALAGDAAAADQANDAKGNELDAKSKLGAADNTGVNANCAATKTAFRNANLKNSHYIGACLANKDTCANRYHQMADAKNATEICPSCTDQAEVEKIVQALAEKATTCDQLQAKAQDNASSMSDSASQAQDCKDTTADNPATASPGSGSGGTASSGSSSAGTASNGSSGSGMSMQSLMPLMSAAMQMMQPKTDAAAANQGSTAAPDCSTTPSLAGCAVASATPAQNWATDSSAGVQKSASNAGGFSLGDSNTGLKTASIDGGGGAGGTPVTTHTVSGSGGGIPGGGGGGGGASLGGGSAGSQQAALGASKTDILHGTGSPSGGYSPASMNMAAGGAAGGYTYGAGAHEDNAMEGLHLADFLPGGKATAGRNVAGVGAPVQIQSSSVNIWTRISDHIRSRCAMGLLRDCGGQ